MGSDLSLVILAKVAASLVPSSFDVIERADTKVNILLRLLRDSISKMKK